MIIAGRLRCKIEIIRPSERNYYQSNASGQIIYSGRAEKTLKTTTEKNDNTGQYGADVFEFKIRYRPGITRECILKENENEYDITGINNVGDRNRELILTCGYITRRGNDRS